ncbi:GDSL-type esterase/lipase family protein [uncultured Clostridium sp.]|uniref:GDSL-type esterase/lipase family protein n=1 Tax=uncultured Clostridium sp. TaxID=59620 RepID=UPI0025EC89CB|nr:GDSL-type esterase/lipase family protein [uncultured Clostridium sp.]
MTKLSTTLLRDLPIKQTSITDEDYVVVSSGGTKKLKVKDITKGVEKKAADLEVKTKELGSQLDNKAKQLEKKINEVATTGTTIETVQNKITEMAQDGSITFNTVTPQMTTFATVSANLFDKDDIEIEKGKFINALGNFTNATGYNISGYIKAKANDKFIHKFNVLMSGKDATFIYCDKNKNKLGYARGVLSEDESTCTVTVPNNPSIRSIRVTFTDTQKLEFMLVSGELYPNKYIPYGEIEFNEKVVFSDIQKSNIKDLSLKAIEEIPIKPNQTSFFITSRNLFDKNDGDIQIGKFINASGGIASANGYNISGFINVVEEQQYIYKFNQSQLGTNATYLYYGDSDNLLGSAKGNISEDGLTCSLTAPIGAKKIKINFMETDRNSLMVVKGNTYPSTYEEYGLIKFDESIGLNDKQKEEVRELGSSNPLEGKIISGNGDSIMYGAGYVGGFLKIIAERNNMIYENIAISGATITQGIVDNNTGKNRHWISATINNMREDADYVLLEGTVNDASQSVPVPIGVISEGYNSSLDVNTFCGAFESMLKQALERFPGKKIGFVLVHKMCDGFNSSKPKNYYHYAIEILEKWGIPYVDLNTECPPLNYINSLKSVYTNNGDGWHPNKLGYEKYYCDKIEQFLISL